MTKLENRIMRKIEQHKNILFFLAISFIGLYVRYLGMRFLSTDMECFLLPWYDAMKQRGGISGLSIRVGNYNVLYETLIALMTYIDWNGMYLYKLLSISFDFVLAFLVVRYICEITGKKFFSIEFNIGYSIVLMFPTVLYNSSFWGQCDVIYTCFLILFLFYLYREKWLLAFICYGVALAFKLQAIFFLPFVVAYYFFKKKFSILLFSLSITVFWILNCAGVFFGRSPWEPFLIYFGQTDTYPMMYLNSNSFWVIAGNSYEWLKNMAVCLTVCLCGMGVYCVLTEKKKMETHSQYLNTCCWFIWTCLLFLPAMHERYTYCLDIILLILCFTDYKYIKYAIVSELLSVTNYAFYLFNGEPSSYWHAFLYVIAWFHYTRFILQEDAKKDIVNNENRTAIANTKEKLSE